MKLRTLGYLCVLQGSYSLCRDEIIPKTNEHALTGDIR